MENIACHFVFYTGSRKGDADAFSTARITVGRAGSNDFRLDADSVAPQHAEILLEEGNVYVLYDLGSKMGTFINGERVHERSALQHEDYVRFGEEGPEVIFRVGQPAPGRQPLPQIFPVTAEMEFFSGSDAGRIFPINAAVVTNIGRRAELEVPLDPRGDMIVSGNHCNIRYLDGHFVLTDTSRNGTYVNGDLVEQPMEILDGDVIMLGEGGPQARLRIDPAKRHYPNHRPLSPVVKPKKAEAESVSALTATPAKPAAAAGPLLASAAPYESGTARPDLASAEPTAEGDVSASEPDAYVSATEPAAGDGESASASELDLDFDDAETGAATAASGTEATGTAETPTEPKGKFSLPAAVPLRHALKFKPGKKLILGAVGVVVVIGAIAMFTSGDDETVDGTSGGNKYAAALADLETVKNSAGDYSVKIPEGWTNLNQENKVSSESPDKKIAIDYVRDPRLNEAKVRQMLGTNGAAVNPKAEEKSVENKKITMMDASIGSVRRVAVLHQPASGPAAVALMETTDDVYAALDEETLNKLLVENLEIAAASADTVASPAPAPAATPEGQLPAPPAAVTATPAATQPPAAAATPAAKETAEPAPTATPGPSPTATAAATETADAGSSPSAKIVKSESLKLSVSVPESWTGVSEEADAMVTLSDGKGLEIRVARDPGDLDAKATFDAMVAEDWTKDGTKTDPRYSAAEFSKEDQNLMLVLIPEKAKTTLVLYATATADFSTEQRLEIFNLIQQLLPAE